MRVRNRYPQTSDCNPDRARVHAGTSVSYLICGGKTNQPTNKTPELFYRKLEFTDIKRKDSVDIFLGSSVHLERTWEAPLRPSPHLGTQWDQSLPTAG